MKQKWNPYAALLLAVMISLSGICSVQAAVPVCADHMAAAVSADANVQSGGTDAPAADDGAGRQADGAGQGISADGTGEGVPADSTGQGDSADGTGQGLSSDGAGQDGSADGMGQDGNAQTGSDQNAAGNGGASDTDGQRPKVNASVSENPEINANVSEDEPETDSGNKKPEVSADVTIDDEEDDHVVITQKDQPYLALGANLNNEQKNVVLNLMGIDPDSLDQYQIVTVTNEEEHQYLDAYLDASIIGTRALSSVVIAKRDKGDGIHISTKNISYCTIGMYKNALATAGLEDADVIIAGPFPLSGTAALIGAMKAYADMEEESLDTESLDAAMNEIVVTGELNESLGDDVQTEEFIAYVKQKVVEGGLESKEKIQEVLAQACDKFEVSLNDEEKERITSLMEKIGSLDIDVDSLLEQAGSIYDSLKEMESSSGFLSRIAAFLKELLDAVIRFFQNLF